MVEKKKIYIFDVYLESGAIVRGIKASDIARHEGSLTWINVTNKYPKLFALRDNWKAVVITGEE